MHWTYVSRQPDADLEQGDFLLPDDELRDILNTVHPHFCAAKYIGFVVITQSCDLVRRGGKSAKAEHVNIATVRTLKDVGTKLVARVATTIAPGLFRRSDRAAARELLTRLFNQNEQALGLFYFHSDRDIGLGDPSVAFLRVSVALRAEHYEALVRARTGGLAPAFQAKLGWLVGNLYSRAATPDWSEQDGGSLALEELIERHLTEQIPGSGPIWIDDELIAAGRQAKVSFSDRPLAELFDELERIRPAPAIDKLADEIAKESKKVLVSRAPAVEFLDQRLRVAAARLAALLKPEPDRPDATGQSGKSAIVQLEIDRILADIKDAAIRSLVPDDRKIETLCNRMRNSGRIKKLLK